MLERAENRQPSMIAAETVPGALNSLLHSAANSCDCLSCQTGRPDYPCLIEDRDD